MRLQSGRPLFLFGSLRDPRVLNAVLGRLAGSSELKPAKLRGWRPVKLRNAPYPALVRSAGSTTEGLLLLKPSPSDVRRIEHYEENRYSIRMLPVTVNGRRVTAQVYADNSSKIKSQLTGVVWSFRQFQQRAPSYLTDVYKWMRRLYESILNGSVVYGNEVNLMPTKGKDKVSQLSSMFDDIVAETSGGLFDFVDRAPGAGLFDFVKAEQSSASLFDAFKEEPVGEDLDKRAKALALAEHLAQIKDRISA